MELLKHSAQVFIVHIPFNGSPPAAASVAANETQLLFAVPTALTPLIAAGKLRALAVSGRTRYALMPEVPTVEESGLKGFDAMAWNGVLVPAATPAAIVERLNREINAALQAPEVRQKLHAAGLEPVGGSAQDFARLMRAENERWGPIIKRAGARVD